MSVPVVDRADELATGWTVRLALARTMPAAAAVPVLVMSRLGADVLIERVVAGERYRAVIPTGQAAAALGLALRLPGASVAGPFLPDRPLDPAEVAAGRWDGDIAALTATATVAFEAAYAVAGEPSPTARTLVTCLLCATGIVSLESRPPLQSLMFRHLNAVGTAALLASILLEG